MSRHNNNRKFWWACSVILVFLTGRAPCTVTSIHTYDDATNQVSHKTPEIEKSSHNRISALGDNKSDNDDKSISRSDKVGNVVFDDNIAFSVSSAHGPDNGRNKRKYFSNNEIAGGLLQNHRLKEEEVQGPLSPELTSSVAAAALASSHGFHSENDLKIAPDNVHLHHTAAVHTAPTNNVVRGAGVTEFSGGQSRSLLPGGEGLNGQYGWASNSGSCLFSCSSGSFGGGGYGSAASCCQQNYVQCCPNAHHEQWNFKNLHHGRGHLLGGGGIGKTGYGWGSLPYNPPPIVRPKQCLPSYHHHAPPVILPQVAAVGGSIIHKGIETIKHNIHNFGQIFKGHGGGWGAGGNGAAGYYFHRRSDSNANKLVQYGSGGDTFSSAKRRATRSVSHGWGNGGFDKVVPLPAPVPCPAYTVQPSYPPRPYSAGLGSLIGWSKPGNQIHGGFGGGYGYSNTITHPPVYSTDKGFGWGGGYGSNFCKSDFECPGYQRCCKGVCQNTPQHIH